MIPTLLLLAWFVPVLAHAIVRERDWRRGMRRMLDGKLEKLRRVAALAEIYAPARPYLQELGEEIGEIFGIPIRVSEHVPPGTMLLVDSRELAKIQDEVLRKWGLR